MTEKNAVKTEVDEVEVSTENKELEVEISVENKELEVELSKKDEKKLDKIIEKKIKERMKSIDKEIAEAVEAETLSLKDKMLRNHAELENFKRRSNEELSRYLKYSSQGVATKLIDVVDNFERAVAVEPEDDATKNFLVGFKMIFDQLMRILDDEDVKVIETVGKEFDPNVHQAVMNDNNPDFESGFVTAELQKGYKLKDRVIRPAMVKVNE